MMREVLVVVTGDGRVLVDSPDGEVVTELASLFGEPDECNPRPVVGDRVWCG